MNGAVVAKHIMVGSLVLLLVSQVAFVAEVFRLDRLGFDQDKAFVLWLAARMAVVAILAIWLAVGARWAYWATVAAAVLQGGQLVIAGEARPLPYALVVVVLAAAVVARPVFLVGSVSADAVVRDPDHPA